MSTELHRLMQEILDRAEQQGITQKHLAERAHLQEASLSRAKSAGDIKFSTLNALARVVGLRLALLPDSDLVEKVRKGSLF